MKRFVMMFAMVLAVAVGVLLPYGVLAVDDWSLGKPGTLAVTEPVWTVAQPDPVEQDAVKKSPADLTDFEIVYRLSRFDNDLVYSLSLKESDETEREWAIQRATSFLEALFEETEIQAGPVAERGLAIFSSDDYLEFWKVQFGLANEWTLTVYIDQETGMVLQFYVMGMTGTLEDLYPQTAQELRNDSLDMEAFEGQVAARVAGALEWYVFGFSSDNSRYVLQYNLEDRWIDFNLESGLYETYFEVKLFEGIYFNNSTNIRPADGWGPGLY